MTYANRIRRPRPCRKRGFVIMLPCSSSPSTSPRVKSTQSRQITHSAPPSRAATMLLNTFGSLLRMPSAVHAGSARVCLVSQKCALCQNACRVSLRPCDGDVCGLAYVLPPTRWHVTTAILPFPRRGGATAPSTGAMQVKQRSGVPCLVGGSGPLRLYESSASDGRVLDPSTGS